MSDLFGEVEGWSLRLQRDGRWLLRGPISQRECDGECCQTYSMTTAADLPELWGRLFWLLPSELLSPVRSMMADAVAWHDKAVQRQRQNSAKLRRAVAARKLADALNVRALESELQGGAL